MKTNKPLLHIVGIIIFLLFPFISSPDFPNITTIINNPNGRNEIVIHLYLVVVFYSLYLFAIPQLLFKKKIGYFIAFSILSISILWLINQLIPIQHDFVKHLPPDFNGPPQKHNPPNIPFDNPPLHKWNLIRSWFFNYGNYLLIITYFIALLIKLNQRSALLEKERIKAELASLHAQINPHFLFNTLNSIYALAIENATYTATAILNLSDMMRYHLSDAAKHTIPLEKEINYIEDYIALQTYRLQETVDIKYQLSGAYKGLEIAPLLMITFIENAFKYGVIADEIAVININIMIKSNQLNFEISNEVNPISNEFSHDGIGLNNTKNRLQLIYPNRHQLNIQNINNKFVVQLKIDL